MLVADKQNRGRGADSCAIARAAQVHDPLVGAKNLGLALLQQIERRFGPLNCVERFHQNPARQIARLVAAHAVGYRPEAGVGAHQA